MLKNIPSILSPELLKILMEMGHGDEIVIADGNFPSASVAQNLIRLDGHGVPPVLEAILKLFPFSRGHTAKDTINKEPWAFGKDVEALCRTALQRRYRLLPYLYTLFYNSSVIGLPVMRPDLMPEQLHVVYSQAEE